MHFNDGGRQTNNWTRFDRLDIAIVNSGRFPEIATTSKLLPLA